MAFDPISLIIGKIIDAHKTRQQIGQGAGENPVQEGMGVNSGIKGLVSGLVGIPGGGGSEALNRVVSKSAPSVMESLGGMPMDHSLAMTALEPSIDPQKPLTGIAKTVDSLSQGVNRFNNLIGKVTNPVNQVVDTATSPITALTSPISNLVGDVTQPVTGVANALAEPIGAIANAIEPLRTPGLSQRLEAGQREAETVAQAANDREIFKQLMTESNKRFEQAQANKRNLESTKATKYSADQRLKAAKETVKASWGRINIDQKREMSYALQGYIDSEDDKEKELWKRQILSIDPKFANVFAEAEANKAGKSWWAEHFPTIYKFFKGGSEKPTQTNPLGLTR